MWQAQGMDDYGTPEKILELRRRDEKEDWMRISTDDLNACHSSLSFFDTEGMRFHLPAFTLFDLKDEDPLAYDCIFSLIHDVNSDLFKTQFSLLNKEQRKAVRNFLLYQLEFTPGYDHRDDRKVILKALEEYWIENN